MTTDNAPVFANQLKVVLSLREEKVLSHIFIRGSYVEALNLLFNKLSSYLIRIIPIDDNSITIVTKAKKKSTFISQSMDLCVSFRKRKTHSGLTKTKILKIN